MIRIAQPLIGEEEKQAVLEALESGQLSQGARVKEFERSFADFCGVRHAVATSSGTTALWTALLAHGIGPGDRVITSPFTFIATANAISYTGAAPVFVDIDPRSLNISPEHVEAEVKRLDRQGIRAKAVLPVHLYGYPCDMTSLMDIASRYGLIVIEDACQAHGASVDGRPVGSFGTGCFSFYPTKNITTAEGGMITTNDSQVAERARMLRNHGSRQRYHHEVLGYNFRMSDLQAAIGLAQMRRLPDLTRRRIRNAEFLTERLNGNPRVVVPGVRPNAVHVFHQYTVRMATDRDGAARRLAELGIESAVYYPLPIHRQPLYRRLGYHQSLPVSELACREVLSLPVHPALSPKELNAIATAVMNL